MQERLNLRVNRKTETLGGRLKLARAKRGLSQDDLAALAGLKQPDISKLERGDMQKTTGIARLAKALRVPAAWLELGEGDEPQWDTEPGKPDLPSSDFSDPKVVTDSGWQLLSALPWIPPEERKAIVDNALKRAAEEKAHILEVVERLKEEGKA